MNDMNLLWVLGHKIRLTDTDDSYGLIEVTSLPKVPGPPPHYHKTEKEFFFIIKGTLDVMRDGEWSKMIAGDFVDLPPNTVHTFINNTEENVIWITGWRPKGFQKFFRDFGISSTQVGAQGKSVSEEIIQKVIENSERYGMFVKK
jgi:quercetin dioxygenase-like cupin family protein